MKDLSLLTTPELLALHANIAEELRERGITRSTNNPTGDLAEHLFCTAFGWKQAGNSKRQLGRRGSGRGSLPNKRPRIARHNRSRQISGIRDLQGKRFGT